MSTAKIVFWVGIVLLMAVMVLLITNLPTLFDVIFGPLGIICGVIAGRKSIDWF